MTYISIEKKQVSAMLRLKIVFYDNLYHRKHSGEGLAMGADSPH